MPDVFYTAVLPILGLLWIGWIIATGRYNYLPEVPVDVQVVFPRKRGWTESHAECLEKILSTMDEKVSRLRHYPYAGFEAELSRILSRETGQTTRVSFDEIVVYGQGGKKKRWLALYFIAGVQAYLPRQKTDE